ncbi:Putative major facilitator superfamily, MFS transporter superfamily [Septoria linicola]|uniref:Major facilitator superfamily, MFS transporter superfamily n=1 Tax=Septoria linicola TaxID=215465 RepID=A0A9Q9EPJ1_9PEZI|nr:Putative major facilitator superfamily, MFS transporter superfamily [Septoria linicola]
MAISEKPIEASSSPVSDDVALGHVEDLQRRTLLQRLKGRTQDPDELGRQLLEKSQDYSQAELERDAVRVRRKLDFLILPMMMGTYMISFLDKQTLNYSNAYGLQQDTNMTGDDYSWVASALNFGWLLAAYPWSLILQRYPIGRLIGCMLFVWGTVCMLQAAVFNFAGFFAIRFFLGALEACVSPAFILLTSMFWKQEEQSLRSSFWLACNGFSSILGALLAYGSGHAEGLAIPNWKLIYIIVGCMTIVWGVVIILFLADGPHNAKQLSEYEKVVAIWRVSSNRLGLKNHEYKWYQVREALLDPKVWLLWLMGAAIGILNGGVANFTSALIKGFGFDALQASLMQTPGGAFEIVGCIAFGFLSRLPGMLCPSIILSCLPGMAGLIGILTINIEHRYALTAMAWLQNVVGSPIILCWTLPGVHVAGHTKRAAVLGVFFAMYCAGNIAGPHLFLDAESPRYPTAIKGLLGAYVAMIVFTMAYWAICITSNKQRDRRHERGMTTIAERFEGFDDLTDRENQHFRYRL